MVILEDIIQACLNKGTGYTITARTVSDFIKSPFKIWCDCYAPNDQQDPLGEYDKLLFEQGKNHEEKTVSMAYPEMERITYSTPKEGFRIALVSMSDGIPAMNNIPIFFLPEGLLGRVDILERKDNHSSIFGNYHYIIKEIKLAKNIKHSHVIQTAFYNYIIGKIQGYTPDQFVLINRDQEEIFYDYCEEKVFDAINGIREIFNGKSISPTYGSCDWPLETFCNNEAIRTNDISLVSNVGFSFKNKLLNAGFKNVSDLANANINDLTAINGIGPKRASGFKNNATAIASDNHVKLKDVIFPSVTTEIFLDLEGTGEVFSEEGLISIDYLIGVLVRKNGEEKYIPFIVHNLTSEDQMIIDFLEWLECQQDYMIYHWHHYEKTHLNRLGERHGVSERLSKSLSGKIRDLYKDTVSCFAFPTYGNGLKQVAKYMGFSWRDKSINAMESVAVYFKYIENPEENKESFEKVLIYNEDDCIATRIVKDWIVAHCS